MDKGFIQRLRKIKGIGYIVMALAAGIALLLLNTGDGTAEVKEDKNHAFVEKTEAELCSIAKELCGVKCKAAVSISGGYQYTYASDQSVRSVYNADGSIAEKETTVNGRTVNVNGGTAMVQVKETPPKISGVALVCSGASAADVSALKALVIALYGLDEDSVFVTN